MTKSIQEILDQQRQESKIHKKSEHAINISVARFGIKLTDEHRKNVSKAVKAFHKNLSDEQKCQISQAHSEGYKKISSEGRANIKAARQNVSDETRAKMSATHKQRHQAAPVTEETKAKAVATRRAKGSYVRNQSSIDKANATKNSKSPAEKFWQSTAQPLVAGEYGVFESRRALVAWGKETKIWANAGANFDKLKFTDPENYKFITKEEYIMLTGKYK